MQGTVDQLATAFMKAASDHISARQRLHKDETILDSLSLSARDV